MPLNEPQWLRQSLQDYRRDTSAPRAGLADRASTRRHRRVRDTKPNLLFMSLNATDPEIERSWSSSTLHLRGCYGPARVSARYVQRRYVWAQQVDRHGLDLAKKAHTRAAGPGSSLETVTDRGR